jgi:hypothetical protein
MARFRPWPGTSARSSRRRQHVQTRTREHPVARVRVCRCPQCSGPVQRAGALRSRKPSCATARAARVRRAASAHSQRSRNQSELSAKQVAHEIDAARPTWIVPTYRAVRDRGEPAVTEVDHHRRRPRHGRATAVPRRTRPTRTTPHRDAGTEHRQARRGLEPRPTCVGQDLRSLGEAIVEGPLDRGASRRRVVRVVDPGRRTGVRGGVVPVSAVPQRSTVGPDRRKRLGTVGSATQQSTSGGRDPGWGSGICITGGRRFCALNGTCSSR